VLTVTGSPNRTYALVNIATANLTDTGGGHTFTVSAWTGSGSLSNASTNPETVVASKSADMTLTNGALSSSDGMSLALSGLTNATLTVTSLSGASYTLDARGFSGTTTLSATGNVSASLLGGSGKDTLSTTSSGNSVLIGNGGNDTLKDTGTGFNILIGGDGLDTITGNGQDILISGHTDYDSNLAALDAILTEWGSSDSYSARITAINQTGVGPSNAYTLNSTTVHADSYVNVVKDGSAATQNNWFLVSSIDSVTKKSNETKTIV